MKIEKENFFIIEKIITIIVMVLIGLVLVYSLLMIIFLKNLIEVILGIWLVVPVGPLEMGE